MAYNGTWKIDRNENYEKFMEAMGKSYFYNAFYKNDTTMAEYKLELSVNYLLASLSFCCLLLCPCIVHCIYFQKILLRGEKILRNVLILIVTLILSNLTHFSRGKNP